MFRMLIVDDEERIVNAMYNLVMDRFEELEVYRSYAPFQALKMIQSMRFDLIMTDIAMPEMDGLELMKRAQEIWPKCHFILLTAYDNFHYAYEALRHEHIDYLLKIESYDVICDCISKRLDLIQKEATEEKKLQRLRLVGSSMIGFFLKRIVIQGIQLPEQKDLDSFDVPLKMDRPVLPVLMAFEQSSLLSYNQSAREVIAFLRSRMEAYGICCFDSISMGSILLAFQFQQEQNENAILYIRNELEELESHVPELMGHHFSILYSERVLSWEECHASYQQAILLLQDLRSDGGVMGFSPVKATGEGVLRTDYPSIDELSALWEIVKSGNIAKLSETLKQGFCQLQNPDRLVISLPNSSISSLSYLTSEVLRLYAPKLLDEAQTKKLLSCNGYNKLEAWLEEIVSTIRRAFALHGEENRQKKNWLIERVQQYMEEHYREDITLTLLAEEMHYSPSYLSRFFKANTGTNVITYLYEIRIAKAQELLTKTNEKISEIAKQTGFCSTKYFNRVFKKHTGLSPMQYRTEK